MSDEKNPFLSDEVTMAMSPTIGAIGAALAKAQLEMRPAIKDRDSHHGKYATLASCIEALKPLHEQGIAVIQPPALHGPDGVCVATLLIHSSGEWIRGELYMPAAKRDAQGFGSALSYARRYCLSATVGLAADDDDGEAAVRGPKTPSRNGASGGQRSSSARGGPPPGTPRAEAANDSEWLQWAMEQTILMKQAESPGQLKAAFADAWRDAESRRAPPHIMASLKKAKDDLKAQFPEASAS